MRTTHLLIVFITLVLILLVVLVTKPLDLGGPSQPQITSKTDAIKGELKIIGVTPDTNEPISDRFTSLRIEFNKPLNESSIKFNILPNNKVRTNVYTAETGSFIVEIIPVDPWNDSTDYQLILSEGIQTVSGISLGKDVLINFTIKAYLGI